MKYLIILASILYLNSACAQKEKEVNQLVNDSTRTDKNFTVSGTIKNVKDRNIIICAISDRCNGGSSLLFSYMDKTTLNLKDSFVFKVKACDENIYYIAPANDFDFLVKDNVIPISIINDTKDIIINVDIKHPKEINIIGSKASKDYMDLSFFIKEKQEELGKKDIPNQQEIKDLTKNTLLKYYQNTESSLLKYLIIMKLSFFKYFSSNEKNNLLVKMNPSTQVKNKVAQFYKIFTQSTDKKKNWIGKPLPNLSLPDTSGRIINLHDFKGKYLLVEFWVNLTPNTDDENHELVYLFNKYAKRNFTIASISFETSRKFWINAIKSYPLTWTQLNDLKGLDCSNAAKVFDLDNTSYFSNLPYNFLVNPQGIIIAEDISGVGLENKLNEILK